MDGFIIHSGLSCTVLSSDGALLPALWLVPKIDWASQLIIPVPEACTNRFIWQKMWHALRQSKRLGNRKQELHASRWWFWICWGFFLQVFFFFACCKWVCMATTVSFVAFCLGAHFHNPPSERVFHYPFVLSVLMTGNQMDVDKSAPCAPPPSPFYNTFTQHTLLCQITLIVSVFSKVPEPKSLNKGAPYIRTTHQRQI